MRRRALLFRVLGLVAVGITIAPGTEPVAAQSPRWEASLTGSRIRYDSLAALNAPALSGLLDWRQPAWFGRVSAGLTGFQDAGWSLQGSGDLIRRVSPGGLAGPFHLEMAGHLAGSRHSSGFDTSLGRIEARAHLTSGSSGAWIGLGAAHARTSLDTAGVTTLVPQVGLWARKGPLQGTLAYQRPTPEDVPFHEWTATVAYSLDRVDVTAFGGLRRGSGTDERGDDRWIGASAAVWLHDNAALVAAGGRYASDVVQGLPGGDYFSVGLRLTPRRVRAVPDAALRSPILYYNEREGASGSITFPVPDADAVEIAGDWNDWSPEPLRALGSDVWALRSGLGPGIYRFNLRVGGEWIVPEGFPSADDGFGGRVGLLIIAEDGGDGPSM